MAAIKTKPICHIYDEVSDWDGDDIRENVCVNDLPLTKHTDGNHYCHFHLPTKDKDTAKFEEIFRARLDSVKQKIAGIEEKPEDERDEAKNRLFYDFRYVWFPSAVDLIRYKFEVRADFRWATFSADADFTWATFSADADFRAATFSAGAAFHSATFSAGAFFRAAIFSADAFFWSATLSDAASFSLATFSADAEFDRAKFLETSRVFFHQTRFCKKVDFNYSVFAGYVAFEGKKDERVFLDTKKVLEVKIELKEKFDELEQRLAEQGIDYQIPDNFEENQEVVLNLQNAQLENPERISFHRVRLCPSWFVNIDSRQMVFTDVSWDNLDRKFFNPNIKTELESLEKRKVSEPNRLLEIACRQLGVNAEENNRYEDASKLRCMAMETKRLEYAWHGRLWTLSWWYRLSSGYGENWGRAALILLCLLFAFSIFYDSPFANFEMPEQKQTTIVAKEEIDTPKERSQPKYYQMNNLEGFVHSLYVAAFQRPEPKAADTPTRLFVILETIFAPLQAALLALAIRRKFMR